jgi:hypothetical protein
MSINKEEKMKRIVITSIVILIIAAVLLGCSPTITKPTQIICPADKIVDGLNKISNLWTEFSDTEKLAGSTPRVSLASPISILQSIKRELDKIEVPFCLGNSKDYISKGMEFVVQAYLDFMAQKPDKQIKDGFTNASNLYEKAATEINRVKACTPNCTY